MPQKKWTMLICATRAWRLSSKVHKDRDIKILFRCATVHGFSCTSRITHAASGFFERTLPSSIFQRCKSRKKLKMTSFKVNLVYCSATFSFRPPQRIERFTRVCIDRYNKRKQERSQWSRLGSVHTSYFLPYGRVSFLIFPIENNEDRCTNVQ